jgi:hypothetical protein
MSDWKEVSEPDDTSHAGVTSGPESLEKLQTLPVRDAALLTAGRETCKEFSIPSKGGFWKISVGRKRVMKTDEIDKLSLYLLNSIILRKL